MKRQMETRGVGVGVQGQCCLSNLGWLGGCVSLYVRLCRLLYSHYDTHTHTQGGMQGSCGENKWEWRCRRLGIFQEQ